jgi:ADP-ribose pyrophosphatase YjhB (NUDIX family)
VFGVSPNVSLNGKQTSSLVCTVIQRDDKKVLVGKHADGPWKGKWGFASLSAETDRRPQDCASKLAEVCTVGMLGRASSLLKQCEKQGRSIKGMHVYVLRTSVSALDEYIQNASAHLLRCFPKSACPPGLVAWTSCKWVDLEDVLTMDTFSYDAMQHLRARVPVLNPHYSYFE